MKHRTHLPIVLTGLLGLVGGLAASATTVPVFAQSKVDQQLFLEIRMLQTQVQQLTLAVNAVGEKLKGTDGKLEAQANALLKGFADQKVQIDAITAQQRTLNEKESDSAVRVLQLDQELKALRAGITQQQTTLNEILTLLQQPGAATGAPTATDPAAPARGGGGSIPPSPTAYYTQAFGYFLGGQYESAIDTLTAAVKKFPESPEAARAQLTIGEANESLRGHDQEALAAYALVIQNYKDPDVVSEAYYKRGLVYERLRQKDNACQSFDQLRKLYPDSSAVTLALAPIKRLGCIK